MTRVVEVPASFDDRTFEQFAASVAAGPLTDKMLFDARGAQWASPYAFVSMLAVAQAITDAKGPKPLFTAPEDANVASYWAKAGFFAQAAELFEIHGKVPKRKAEEESHMLLPVTAIRALERFNPWWSEEPIPPENIELLASGKQQTGAMRPRARRFIGAWAGDATIAARQGRREAGRTRPAGLEQAIKLDDNPAAQAMSIIIL